MVAYHSNIQNFDASPYEKSLLASNIYHFWSTDATNRTFDFEYRWCDIMRIALSTKVKPAMWFFGSAVGYHDSFMLI